MPPSMLHDFCMERFTDVLSELVLGNHGYSAPAEGIHTVKPLSQGQAPASQDGLIV
jgi:hypothetical protein